jgi:hypothetical protein
MLRRQGMGAWGYGSFENDSALDAAYAITSEREVHACLMSDDPNEVLAAGEVVAAACGAMDQPGLYQSEGTGLMAMIMIGGDKDEARKQVATALGGEHYLHEDIAVAARTMRFDARACAEAALRVRETCLGEGGLADWTDPESRRQVVEAVIARIEHFAPPAEERTPEQPVPDEDCL